jgi:hypothetical protein
MKTWLATVAILISTICGVTVVAAADPEALADIDVWGPGGFVDLRLTIRSVERTVNGEMAIEAMVSTTERSSASARGCRPRWPRQKSTAAARPSDGLIVTMARLHHVPSAPQRVPRRSPRRRSCGGRRGRGRWRASSRSCSSMTAMRSAAPNLDLATNTLERFEQDPDYRVNVSKALAEQSAVMCPSKRFERRLLTPQRRGRWPALRVPNPVTWRHGVGQIQLVSQQANRGAARAGAASQSAIA